MKLYRNCNHRRINITIEPTEFAEQLCAALHEQRVKASRMLADAIDNQVYIIAEIGQKLRTEYKDYLK